MNNRLIFASIIFCGFLPISLANAYENETQRSIKKITERSTVLVFPTADQFLALSEDQQLRYLRGLQEVTSQMVNGSSLFADYSQRYFQLVAQLAIRPALASSASQAVSNATTQLNTFKSASPTTDETVRNQMATEAFAILSRAFDIANKEKDNGAKAEILRAYQRLQGQISADHDSLNSKTLNYIEAQGNRLQKTVSNPPSDASAGSQPPYKERTRTGNNLRATSAHGQERRKNTLATQTNSAGAAVNGEQKAATEAATGSHASTRARGGASATSSPAASGASLAPANQNAPPDKAEKNDENFNRSGCMYAGFVLLGDRCEAPGTLPDQFLGKTPFDESKFKCEKRQAICNPLLFGFDIQAPEAATKNCEDIKQIQSCYQYSVPICVPASRTATKDCKDKTDSKKYLERAQALIKAKKELFTKYTDDFRTICDKDFIEQNKLVYYDSTGKRRNNSDYYKNDILSTCERAAPKFEQLYENTIGSKFNYKEAPAPGRVAPHGTSGGTAPPGKGALPAQAQPAASATSAPGSK